MLINSNHYNRLIVIFFYLFCCFPAFGQIADSLFIKGVDISTLPQIEDLGAVFSEGGAEKDVLQIFKDNGINYIRLKLWHTPPDEYNSLAHILEMADRIKNQGLKFLLNFHYSDTWADPGSQAKPAAWKDLSFTDLVDSVYDYTYYVIAKLDSQNTLPDMVQIGNEINQGLLFEDGRVSGSNYNDQKWTQLGQLLKAGINGVKDAANGNPVKIMIHRADADGSEANRWFFDGLIANGVDFDIIGLSFYPWWHGTLTGTQSTLDYLANRYGKDIIIAETAYPWTLGWNDSWNNIVGSSDDLHTGYPATVAGQGSFLYDLVQIVRNVQNNKGAGVFYWEPAYISVEPLGSPWENMTLFDFQGNLIKQSIELFTLPPVEPDPIHVKMIVNTSTNHDTVSEGHFVQIRGDLTGLTKGSLPDGKKLSWDASSDLIMSNMGGDYWQLDFQINKGDELSYKIWTGIDQNSGTFKRAGFEGGVEAFNGSVSNTRILIAGPNDTTIKLQYYSPTSEVKEQYWRPYNNYEDSIGIYFRVNMGKATSAGRFNPDINGPVGVRGDSLASAGGLSWNETLPLSREESSINEGSFWSGTVYLPKSNINPGQIIEYKFFIENDISDGWEDLSENRSLIISESLIDRGDTTLLWDYFANDYVNAIDPVQRIPADMELFQNYPNPFNPHTTITYNLKDNQEIRLVVVNTLGEIVCLLDQGTKPAGSHRIQWDGKGKTGNRLSSGIFFIRLQTLNESKTIKVLLLK